LGAGASAVRTVVITAREDIDIARQSRALLRQQQEGATT
jgi:hypothetical protein